MDYARGETVQSPEKRFRGFALVLKGRALLLSSDADGRPVEIANIGPGEYFGDQLTGGGSTEDIGIVAAEDLKIMVFDNRVIDDLLNRSPGLAAEIGDAIEARLQAAHAARSNK